MIDSPKTETNIMSSQHTHKCVLNLKLRIGESHFNCGWGHKHFHGRPAVISDCHVILLQLQDSGIPESED